MFARNLSIHLKPNTLKAFNQTLDKEVIPMLIKQSGFRDEIAFTGDNEAYVTAISFWDTKEQAEAYNTSTYPAVLKSLDKYLDGQPKVRISHVISSTSYKLPIETAVATA